MLNDDSDQCDVITKVDGRAGVITLNRPVAINSLTVGMVAAIDRALSAWAQDPAVFVVVLQGAGERGLCAGADLRTMRASALAADGTGPEFFRSEYRLNARIARYSKPYVAIMDGVTMGGGIGLSAHGSVRVVTERSRLAMPEVTIGFVPDVGGTWLLSRAPGETGTYLALTAEAVGAGDAIAMGLADHLVRSERLPELLDRIREEAPEAVLDDLAENSADAPIMAMREWIDQCFAGDDIRGIVSALEDAGLPDASAAAATLRTKSPTALAVALASLRQARRLESLEDALTQEFGVSCSFLDHPDLAEGIRALIIDKDREPRWLPETIDQLEMRHVHSFFSNDRHGPLVFQADA